MKFSTSEILNLFSYYYHYMYIHVVIYINKYKNIYVYIYIYIICLAHLVHISPKWFSVIIF